MTPSETRKAALGGADLSGKQTSAQTIQANPTTGQAQITRLTAHSRVGKRFYTNEEGGITALPAANLARWPRAETLDVPTAEALAGVIKDMTVNQAILLGTAPGMRDYSIGPDQIITSRSQAHFSAVEGEGWVLLDFDRKGMPAAVRARMRELGGALPALLHVWPELAHAARVVRPSSSAGVHREGEDAPDLSAAGLHVFARIADAPDRRAYLEAVHARAWAEGLGWIVISASGALLVRSIIDVSVYGPERLVFVAPPELDQGLVRTVPEPVWQEGKTLTLPDAPDVRDLILAAKREAAPDGHKVRRAFVKRQVTRVMDSTGISARAAFGVVRQRIEGGVLHDHDTLELRDGTITTVGELLDRTDLPDRYGLPCPIEGRSYGTTTATLIRERGRDPILISFAHGTVATYRFARFTEAENRVVGGFDGHLSAKEARELLSQAAARFARDADASARGMGPGEVFALQVGVGIGKTRAAVAHIAEIVRGGDDLCQQRAVVYAVPNHKLGEQVKRDLETHGLTVAHLRGPDAPHPVEDRKMCVRAQEFIQRQTLMLDPYALCSTCPLSGACDYVNQKTVLAEVYIVAHAALTQKAPPATAFRRKQGQTMAALIVDEDAVGARVYGADGKTVVDLDHLDQCPSSDKGLLRASIARHVLRRIAEINGPGYLTRETLNTYAKDLLWSKWDEFAREARAAEWRRKTDDEEEAHANLSIKAVTALWHEIGKFARGNASVSGRVKVTATGFRVSGVRPLGEGYAASALLLDATLVKSEVAAVWGDTARVTTVKAVDGALVKQDKSKSGSKAMLLAKGGSESAQRASANWQKRLRAFLLRYANGKTLVVTYRDLIKKLDLPEGIHTAHFGALRGLNDFETCTRAIIIGRPLMNEWSAKAEVEAIFDRPAGAVNLRDFTGDPDVLARAKAVRDGEVEQAVGRLRLVNRNAEEVEVIVLGDAELNRPVMLVSLWDEIARPSPLQRQADVGPVALASPGHAAATYPGLWGTARAAQIAWGAAGLTGERTSYISLYDVSSPVEGFEEPLWTAPTTAQADDAASYADWAASRAGTTSGAPYVLTYRVPRRAEVFLVWADPSVTDPVAGLIAAVPAAKEVQVRRRPKKLFFAATQLPRVNLPTQGRTYRVDPNGVGSGEFKRILWPTPRDHQPSEAAMASLRAFATELSAVLQGAE